MEDSVEGEQKSPSATLVPEVQDGLLGGCGRSILRTSSGGALIARASSCNEQIR